MKANWDDNRYAEAKTRAYIERWSKPAKARVVHPTHGSIIVPCGSGLSSIMCAADIWKVPWDTLMDARVEHCDQNLPVIKPAM